MEKCALIIQEDLFSLSLRGRKNFTNTFEFLTFRTSAKLSDER